LKVFVPTFDTGWLEHDLVPVVLESHNNTVRPLQLSLVDVDFITELEVIILLHQQSFGFVITIRGVSIILIILEYAHKLFPLFNSWSHSVSIYLLDVERFVDHTFPEVLSFNLVIHFTLQVVNLLFDGTRKDLRFGVEWYLWES